jgi:hypothetical protein
MRTRKQGQALLETALYLPFLFLFLFGTIELGKVVYTYFALQKALYSIGRLAATAQGIDLCNTGDPILAGIENVVLTGSSDGQGTPIIQGLAATDIQIRVERFDPVNNVLTICDCSVSGCDTNAGGLAPDFIVISLANGYPVAPVFPLFHVDPFPLRPQIRMPFGGT